MLIVKYTFKTIIFFFLLIALLLLYNVGIVSFGRLSDKVNQQSISLIKLGMSKCDVINILGAPLNTKQSCIMSAEKKVDPKSIVMTYEYSKPGVLWGIEIAVGFHNNKVIYVNMQEGDANFFVYDTQHIDKEINLEVYNRIIPLRSKK